MERFRRMGCNAFISNTDDPPRNHAILARERDWRLAPTYDLTPANPISRERRDLAMACADKRRCASVANLQSPCARFLTKPEEAVGIIRAFEECVKATWYPVARAEGVSERNCDQIRGAFIYPGFRLPAPRD